MMSRARTTAVAALVLVGCGGSSPPAQPPKPAPVAAPPIATAPAARAPLFVEVVAIREAWVREVMPAEPEAVKAWAATPEVGLGGDVFWHILSKSKKEADAAQAILKKGEPFARVARNLSTDPGSVQQGGYYPAKDVDGFVPEVKAAFAKLKSGETTAQPVKSSFGWHIIRKAPLDVEQLEPLYRKAKAPELTTKLAKELANRFRAHAETRPAIADSVTATLGDLAASDEHRPAPATIERDELKSTRLPEAAKAGLGRFADGAKPGDVLPDPILAPGEIIVARTGLGPS